MNQYKCHCIIHSYDGITTLVKNETQEVEAQSEERAREQVTKTINNRYRMLQHLSLSSLTITIEKEGKP